MKFDPNPTFAKLTKNELKYLLIMLSLAMWITAAITWFCLMLVPFGLSERLLDTEFDSLEMFGSIFYIGVYFVIRYYKKKFEKQIIEDRVNI